jgi:branched-chain amino acid transport system permease protein
VSIQDAVAGKYSARNEYMHFALLACILLVLPLALNTYWVGLLTEVMIFSILAMGLNLLAGYTGLISIGHGAFFGLGAYVVILLNVLLGWNAWFGLLAAVSLSGIAAAFVGWFCVRLTGISFLMLTLATSQLFFSLAAKWRSVTNGTDGIGGLVRPSILGFSLNDRWVIYLVVLCGFIAVLCLMKALIGSALGSVFLAIRENEQRAEAIGYQVKVFKAISFIIAGAISGFGGALYALYSGYVSPDLMHWSTSGDALLMVIIGGVGTMMGPAVGAALFLLFKYAVSSYTDHWMLVIGVIFITTVMILPKGVVGGFPVKSLLWRRS